MAERLVSGDQNLERRLGRRGEELAVPELLPAEFGGGPDFMWRKVAGATIDTVVEQELHAARPRSCLRASSRTAIACSRVTPGNPSRNSSRESPASRYSK